MASTSIPLVNSGYHVLLQVLGEDRKIQPKQTNENKGGGGKRDNTLQLPYKQASMFQPSTFFLTIL